MTAIRKILACIAVTCLSYGDVLYADAPLYIPGDISLREKITTTNETYTSHILAAFDTASHGESLQERIERISATIDTYPSEVNDIAFMDGLTYTPLICAIYMNNYDLVKKLLDMGAIPFSYRGDEDIIESIQSHQYISPEIIKLIRTAQAEYKLIDIILRDRK